MGGVRTPGVGADHGADGAAGTRDRDGRGRALLLRRRGASRRPVPRRAQAREDRARRNPSHDEHRGLAPDRIPRAARVRDPDRGSGRSGLCVGGRPRVRYGRSGPGLGGGQRARSVGSLLRGLAAPERLDGDQDLRRGAPEPDRERDGHPRRSHSGIRRAHRERVRQDLADLPGTGSRRVAGLGRGLALPAVVDRPGHGPARGRGPSVRSVAGGAGGLRRSRPVRTGPDRGRPLPWSSDRATRGLGRG